MRNQNISIHPAIGVCPIINAWRGVLGVRDSFEKL